MNGSYTVNLTPSIRKIIFSFDFIMLSVSTHKKSTPGTFFKALQSRYKLTRKIPERFTKTKAWKRDFRTRTYYKSGAESYIMALTDKARPLAHLDFITIMYNPSRQHIVEMRQFLNRNLNIRSHVVSGVEFTFDHVMKKQKYREQLRKLIKLSGHLSYGRLGFEYGDYPLITQYLNSRESVKQIRAYPKENVVHRGEIIDPFRFEMTINRAKAKRIGVNRIDDLLGFDFQLLDEFKLFFFDPYNTWRSLTNFNTRGYFSELIAGLILRKGFQQAQSVARGSIKCCPKNCFYFEFICPVCDLDASASGKARFKVIQRCKHSVQVSNFRRDFAYELENFDVNRDEMKEAFEKWRKP